MVPTESARVSREANSPVTVTKASLEHTAMKVRPLTLPLPGSGRGVCIVSVETSAGFPLRLGSKTEVCLIYELTDASEPSHFILKCSGILIVWEVLLSVGVSFPCPPSSLACEGVK